MNNFAKDLDQMELPEIHSSDGKEYFLDPVRKKLILKTPEEVIRQTEENAKKLLLNE